MSYYDEQLRFLQNQCARKKKLEAAQRELHRQRYALTEQVEKLKQVMAEEQEDVDRLEGRSLAAFFYHVVGKMDEKLTVERQEAYAAKVKYDAAARELAGVELDLQRCQSELDSLQGCEARYRAVLDEKIQAVKNQGGETAAKILQIEERAGHFESQKKELREALEAGNAALASTDQILSSLDSAEGWGTLDLFGGGLISDLAKHGHLDDAQEAVEHLQSQLRAFQTELADVEIEADLQVRIDGFLRFADYFFDGLLTDWAVLDHIHQSQDQVQATRTQICSVLDHLRVKMAEADREIGENKNQLETLVHSVKM